MRLVEPSNVCSYDGWVVFLVRRDSTDASAAWWHELRRYDSAAPAIIRELLRGPSVVANAIEIRQAVPGRERTPRGATTIRRCSRRRRRPPPDRSGRDDQPHVDVARRRIGLAAREHAS